MAEPCENCDNGTCAVCIERAKQQLLKDAVADLMVAGPEINQEGQCQGALWALYDCLFGILEYLGAEGLPRKESEGEERG